MIGPRARRAVLVGVLASTCAAAPDRGGERDGGGGEAQPEPGAPTAIVVVAPAALRVLGDDELVALPSEDVVTDGETVKTAISVRALAALAGGQGARVVAVVDRDYHRHEVDPAIWGDVAMTPLLRKNRRGLYKLAWAKGGIASRNGEVFAVAGLLVLPGEVTGR